MADEEAGSPGTAGRGYRIPEPREPVVERVVDDPTEPGAHRMTTRRSAGASLEQIGGVR